MNILFDFSFEKGENLIEICAWVLMNNHFHLLVSTPDANLDRAMNYLMRETSRVIGWRAGRINQVYGGPYNWSVLMSQHYYLNAYKYVYRNPVEAGLATAVENYKFSTLPGLLGAQLLVIPVEDDEILFSDANQKLAWLNESYPNEQIRLDNLPICQVSS